MWNEHRDAPYGLSDLVNYADLVSPGVLQLKDGALLAAWHYRGPDLDLASPQEMERLSTQVSTAFLRCGNGWMLHCDVMRRDSRGYLPAGAFPDPTSALIDEERRRYYHREAHYESVQAFALTYKPPPELMTQVASLFVADPKRKEQGQEVIVASFLHAIAEIEDQLTGVLRLARMTDDELLTYLHFCVTGVDQPLRAPRLPADLDALIANQDFASGFTPQIGDQHVRVISVDSFPPLTEPGAQAFLHEVALPYRWSTRFLFLDRVAAETLIDTKRKYWLQQRQGIGGKVAVMASGLAVTPDREDALQMATDANTASAEAASGEVIFGLYTMTVVVMDEEEARVELTARDVRKHIERCGFGARIERGNAVEALMGSWPGHGYQNVRRAPVHSLNLADMLALTSVWAGSATHPSPYFPAQSPPLLIAATSGRTPFRLAPYVNEVGHTLIIGPTRSGKSTLINLWVAQFLRYANAQIFWFDKGYSSYVLAQACGAQYYDIGAAAEIAFAPLAQVDDAYEREWALGWIEELLVLQGLHSTPEQRRALWRALTLMGERAHSRTISGLITDVQDREVKAALEHYAVGGGAGSLLDATNDSLSDGRFLVFEMGHLLARGDKDLIPVLLYLFHRIDKRCAAGVPTFIPIDEAWIMMLRSLFAQKIEQWLREKAKQNAAIAFVSQSLADVERCPQRNILVESCQTKILLPNADARTTQSQQLYLDLGLNERQIEALASASPQKHYLYLSPYGRRLFDLHLGPVAKAFTGAGSREEIHRVQELIARHGAVWPTQWLREQGCEHEAHWRERWHATYGHVEEGDDHATLWADMVGTAGGDGHPESSQQQPGTA